MLALLTVFERYYLDKLIIKNICAELSSLKFIIFE